MLKSPLTTLCTLALCFGFGAPSAKSQVLPSTRTAGFTFVCDGQPKQTTVAFAGFTPNTTQTTAAARINLFQQQGGLQYVILGVSGTPNGNLAILAGGGSPIDHGNNNSDGPFYSTGIP